MANNGVGLVHRAARQKLGEIGTSVRSATDSLMDAIRPPEPYQVVGVSKDGSPLYKNPLGFGPPVSREEYDRISGQTDLALGMLPMGNLGRMGTLGRMASAPKPVGLPRPTAEVLPPDPSIFNRGPGRIVDPLPRSPEILPPGNNPFARPGRVVDPLPRTGTGLATTGGASTGMATTGGTPAQGGGLGFPRQTGLRVGESGPMPSPMPGAQAIPKDPFAGFGNQFSNINYGPDFKGMAKGLGATMLGGSALAAGAGALSARNPQMPQPEPPPQSAGDYPTMMGAGIAAGAPYRKDADGAGMNALRGLGEPQLPPEPLRVSGRNKRRGVPVAQSQTATRAIQQAVQQPAVQEQMQAAGNQSGSSGPGYWIDMLQAADTGDAYARDLVALREQARGAAIAAAQRGDSQQFVPIMDYRGNKMHFVNAGGGDVVLDLNDEQDRAQYQRIIAKTGLPAEQVQQWASRASRPLMGYFERGGGPRRPEFDRTPAPTMPPQ